LLSLSRPEELVVGAADLPQLAENLNFEETVAYRIRKIGDLT
jgi:hypothetical protein